MVDAGARQALATGSKSLLAIGIRDVNGDFEKGDVVGILDPEGQEFARGLTNYASAEVRRIHGLHTQQAREALGSNFYDESSIGTIFCCFEECGAKRIRPTASECPELEGKLRGGFRQRIDANLLRLDPRAELVEVIVIRDDSGSMADWNQGRTRPSAIVHFDLLLGKVGDGT